MANLFITDAVSTLSRRDPIDPNIEVYLKHPRVTKITVGADGSMTIDLKDTDADTNNIIRKQEGLHKANKTGFRGVSIRGSKYRADISEDGIQYNLGTFETMQEAIEARIKAELGLDQ